MYTRGTNMKQIYQQSFLPSMSSTVFSTLPPEPAQSAYSLLDIRQAVASMHRADPSLTEPGCDEQLGR